MGQFSTSVRPRVDGFAWFKNEFEQGSNQPEDHALVVGRQVTHFDEKNRRSLLADTFDLNQCWPVGVDVRFGVDREVFGPLYHFDEIMEQMCVAESIDDVHDMRLEWSERGFDAEFVVATLSVQRCSTR